MPPMASPPSHASSRSAWAGAGLGTRVFTRRSSAGFATPPEKLLVVRNGFSLATIDPASHPGFHGGKEVASSMLASGDSQLADLQSRLFAQGRQEGRSVLLVLQGMDTAGKGGIISHVVGAVDVQGVHVAAFRAPSPEEKAHDFLWRIEKELPGPGVIGCFDRSHYEDVLIHRVHGWASGDELERRYAAIIDFESRLLRDGITLIKVMLHISAEEQRRRLLARLNDPAKRWKFSPDDVTERSHWAQYMEAYQVALARTSSPQAPWYVVPADDKWYARLAVQRILVATLDEMHLSWPKPTYDVAEQRRRLAGPPP